MAKVSQCKFLLKTDSGGEYKGIVVSSEKETIEFFSGDSFMDFLTAFSYASNNYILLTYDDLFFDRFSLVITMINLVFNAEHKEEQKND